MYPCYEINTRNGIPDNVVSHITTVKIVTGGAGRRGNSPSDVYSHSVAKPYNDHSVIESFMPTRSRVNTLVSPVGFLNQRNST